MKKEWVDCTTYNRDDKERNPTSWELKTRYLRLVIVSNHRDYPDFWIMHCYNIGVTAHNLLIRSSEPKEIAQEKAIRIAKIYLNKMLDSLATTHTRNKES